MWKPIWEKTIEIMFEYFCRLQPTITSNLLAPTKRRHPYPDIYRHQPKGDTNPH